MKSRFIVFFVGALLLFSNFSNATFVDVALCESKLRSSPHLASVASALHPALGSRVLEFLILLRAKIEAGRRPNLSNPLLRFGARLESELFFQTTYGYLDELRQIEEMILEASQKSGEVSAEDLELLELAREDQSKLRQALAESGREAIARVNEVSHPSVRSVIMEIRAGAPFLDPQVFVGKLYSAYVRFAAKLGWTVEIIDSTEPADNFKVNQHFAFTNVVLRFKQGSGAVSPFKFLRHEVGVHQRWGTKITDKSQITNSEAHVLVYPELETTVAVINPSDVVVETMKGTGAGGQHVNTTDSTVRVRHIPTGIEAIARGRSQHSNRANAMALLEGRLAAKAQNDRASSLESTRRAQMSSHLRVRTYREDRSSVVDISGHRTNSVTSVYEGELLPFALASEEKSLAETLEHYLAELKRP